MADESIEDVVARAHAEGWPVERLAEALRAAGISAVEGGGLAVVARAVDVAYRAAEVDGAYLAGGLLSPAEVRESRFEGLTFNTVAEHAEALSNGGTRWDQETTPGQILRDLQALTDDISRQAFAPMAAPSPYLPIVPMAFDSLAPMTNEPAGMSLEMRARTGGVVVRMPGALSYMEAIDYDNVDRDDVDLASVGILEHRDVQVGRRWIRLVPHSNACQAPNPGASMRFNGRKVERSFLGSLAARYGVIHWSRPRIAGADDAPGFIGNRHHAKRWLRRFSEVAAVASDMLESDKPRACFELLCEHITLEDAMRLAYGPPDERGRLGTPIVASNSAGQVVREYTDIRDIERDFGASSAAYESALGLIAGPATIHERRDLAVVQRGVVAMLSSTPLEVGDPVTMGDQPNAVRHAELDDAIVGRVDRPAGDTAEGPLYWIRVGEEVEPEVRWMAAVERACRELDLIPASQEGVDQVLDHAIRIVRRWYPGATGEAAIEMEPRGRHGSAYFRARLGSVSVYTTFDV